jgi:hypothetical protein
MPRNNQNQLPFDKKLVLSEWIFDLLEVDNFKTLQDWLIDPQLEGLDEENVTHFCRVLCVRLFERQQITQDELLRYDSNIVRHWLHINEKRSHANKFRFQMKYFQYLALLFTEIYLDRYFNNPADLLMSLNDFLVRFNFGHEINDQIQPFVFEELNKVAFWMATGSGKTLLMHCNLLQYQHYLRKHGRENEVNRVLLLTPNEGLSIQHLREFEQSGIPSALFSKNSIGAFLRQDQVEIIDIHKLGDANGDKTVDVAAFEGNNLVLVDEGHSGASSGGEGQWMTRRAALCENGFSFEYSATFGQAIRRDNQLTQVYAKSILFDYSYRFFYRDGYGKEYSILNLANDEDEEQRTRYLSACLLAFYQQQKIYQQRKDLCNQYLLEKPLWVFVGGSVNAVRSENRRQVSDVVDILLFLAEFANPQRKNHSLNLIEDFINNQTGLLDANGQDIFEDTFRYLNSAGNSAELIYNDIIHSLFNASAPALLHVENLKGSDGEIGLRLGENDYFGLINVGDAPKLCKLCEEQAGLVVDEQPISGSIFQELEKKESMIHILIGSRKFMEGWNSWRVSTMGLMNLGRAEGTQIIQLFGRGVRLKGKGFSLKRSSSSDGRNAPPELRILETLNIFGVRADYMRQFREYLEEEGIRPEENLVEFIMPVVANLGTQKLKVVRLPEGLDFKRQGPKPTLDLPFEHLQRHPVVLNQYPAVQSLRSIISNHEEGVALNTDYFRDHHIAFMDLDAIYFEISRFKNERAWFNLNLSRDGLTKLLLDHSWYTLLIPAEEMELRNFERVRRWEQIAIALLKKYCDAFYKYEKARWENERLELQELSADDSNFIREYEILYDKSREDICQQLTLIKQAILNGEMNDLRFERNYALFFSQHLYQPLLYLANGSEIEIKPVTLNEGEKLFVTDLRKYYHDHPAEFEEKDLYLLRNRSRGGGIGFFEAGNFYPDFILWLVKNEKQYINFIDPKGLGRMGARDPKVAFFMTIKELETRLNDKDVILNSFIVSNTHLRDIPLQEGVLSQADWEERHVLFQQEDRDGYIEKLFDKIKK